VCMCVHMHMCVCAHVCAWERGRDGVRTWEEKGEWGNFQKRDMKCAPWYHRLKYSWEKWWGPKQKSRGERCRRQLWSTLGLVPPGWLDMRRSPSLLRHWIECTPISYCTQLSCAHDKSIVSMTYGSCAWPRVFWVILARFLCWITHCCCVGIADVEAAFNFGWWPLCGCVRSCRLFKCSWHPIFKFREGCNRGNWCSLGVFNVAPLT
jgi:hypothetical protein